jgi:hypothetical protein
VEESLPEGAFDAQAVRASSSAQARSREISFFMLVGSFLFEFTYPDAGFSLRLRKLQKN